MRSGILRLASGFLCCGLMAVPAAHADKDSIHLTLVSSKPDMTYVDVGPKGSSIGDYQIFSAGVRKNDEPFGMIYGLKLELTRPGAPSEPEGMSLFQNQITFMLPDGTISITGVQHYATDGSIPGKSLEEGETRSIVGGTGAYVGARGTVRTTARLDGTRLHELDFEIP